ncbi:MAG: hypothetical protein SFT92_08470 [Rickettsiales bacterium]|nr:hypothetical protein [Rickettsiales bacterium]
MKKLVFVSSMVALIASAGAAGAVTLKNTDKTDVTVAIEQGGKTENTTIKAGESFDSKGKDVSITLGKEKPVMAKGDEQLVIKDGKLEVVKLEVKTTVTEPVKKPEEVKVEVKTPTPDHK